MLCNQEKNIDLKTMQLVYRKGTKECTLSLDFGVSHTKGLVDGDSTSPPTFS